MTVQVNVADVVENSPFGWLHTLILCTGFLIMLIDGYDLIAMAMTLPVVSEDWGMEPSAFSLALSSVLLGVLVGSGCAGLLGDLIGRRKTIILMLLIAGVAMLLTTRVQTMNQLIAVRFLTGTGAGGCIPVTLAYTLEFMPVHLRNRLTTAMYTGAGMGSVVAGFVGPTLIDLGGWQLVFFMGGAVSLLIMLAVAALLPESIVFEAKRGGNNERVGITLTRLNPSFTHAVGNSYGIAATAVQNTASPIKFLFGERQTSITLYIWLVFFANQFLVFYTGTWMPTLFVNAGISLDTSLYILALFNLGGVLGGILFGAAGDKFAPPRVLTLTYIAAAMLVAFLGFAASSTPLLSVVAFCAGACILGSSFLLGTMTTALYPVQARATGIGWALAVGRFGSISSPLLGGFLLSGGFSMQQMFLVATVPAVVAAIGVFWLKNRTGLRN